LTERGALTRVRAAIEQGVNVRRTVPSLWTWLAQGPRRAMKQFLRRYEQHQRGIGLATLDAFHEIDGQWLTERASFTEQLRAQEAELQQLREGLREAQLRLATLEEDGHGRNADPARREVLGQ
jgi:hypothetical protein